MSHKAEMEKNGSGFKIQGMLEPPVFTPSKGELHWQLCVKQPITPHHGSSYTTVIVAAILAAVIASGY